MGILPNQLTHDQWIYRGWQISFDMPPIPDRSFDWTAQSPDFDADCDQDGFFQCAGGQVHAATYEDLLAEIDMFEADLADDMAVDASVDMDAVDRIVREAREFLDTLSPERRAELQREWECKS